MMKPNIGVIISVLPEIVKQDKIFLKTLKKKFNVHQVRLEEVTHPKQLKSVVEKCKLFVNLDAAEPILQEVLAIAKTLEKYGAIVVNPTETYYYNEDKWMFYLHCLEHNLSTPKTIFVPKDPKKIKKKIEQLLEKGPLVFKPTTSDQCCGVMKAKNLKEAIAVIKKIKKEHNAPIIAQRFISYDYFYRVTLIGGKVVQTVKRFSKKWPMDGYSEYNVGVMLNSSAKKLCEKTSKVLGLEWCGIDLMEKNGHWYLIEANGSAALDYLIKDTNKICELFTNFLYKKARSLL